MVLVIDFGDPLNLIINWSIGIIITFAIIAFIEWRDHKGK